jgi:hypothetical protein
MLCHQLKQLSTIQKAPQEGAFLYNNKQWMLAFIRPNPYTPALLVSSKLFLAV